jgi:hypothetical protein
MELLQRRRDVSEFRIGGRPSAEFKAGGKILSAEC